MNKSDKRSWDKLIYGLIYPGFLGSMIYELIPSNASNFTLTYFFATSDNYIRYFIIIFYTLDYLHLYGDMDPLFSGGHEKRLVYFVVDIVTCLSYLAAFIALNRPSYWATFVVFGTVPWLFRVYKRGNPHDREFFALYGLGTTLILTYRLLCIKWRAWHLLDDNHLAVLLVAGNVGVYWYYIGWFYERRSKLFDKTVLYPQTPAGRDQE